MSEDGGQVEPIADGAAGGRGRLIAQMVVAVLFLALILFVLLPQLIDYRAVWDALTKIEPWQIGVLLALGFLRIFCKAWQNAAVIPGLPIGTAARAYLSANSLADFAPPPADLAVRYGMYRAQGIDTTMASTGILLTGLYDNAAKLAIPVFTLVVLVASGVDDQAVWELLVIGGSALVGGIVIVALALRSEQFTVRFGEALGRTMSWFLVRLRRNPLERMGERASDLRRQVGETLRTTWVPASIATTLGHVVGYATMLAALRFLGVSNATIDWVDLLIAYTIVLLVSIVPITPGGLGVAAVVYTAVLAIDDPALANVVAAASLLTRVFTWLLPILVGLVPLAQWRRSAGTGHQALIGEP